ncbi:MAG TPA: 1-(5-phosphoribosyl)-5-[(5-phosphoribosylamino)methylideneamino]imidazole-4-carboxamide isomerase [Abditibacteriaceae bacterium]|jgi:phosphoribosylformimino-5-aminoimidazole carboxamide ribotide isomerase
MSFEIIPAIDLRGGQCVRLLQGNYNEETVYGNDPVAMARRWQDEGGTRLHVVDLDGAREGAPANLEVIGQIAQALSIPVQMGGGLRTGEAIQRVLDAGVQRCIIGTQAAARPEWAQQMFAQFGDSIILGIDARNGIVATEGWQESSGIPAVHFAQAMQNAGCARIIFTDIARDGTLAGPNAAALREIAEAVEIPVIASGGVHKSTDVRILRNIPNVEGVIVGKALYEGTATLPHLIKIAGERETQEVSTQE